MKPILYDVLSVVNSHQRDKNIRFFEEGHKYVILTEPDTPYTSVTTWNHSHFPHFDADEVIRNMMNGKGWKEGHKYWGLTPKQIKDQWSASGKDASEAGTAMHLGIEQFHNGADDLIEPAVKDTAEWKYFQNYWRECGWRRLRHITR